MVPSLTAVFVLVPLAVITLHEAVLRRVEVDHLVLPILATAGFIYLILAYFHGPLEATILTSSFWCTLGIYVSAYRVFFHPLRAYPGPLGARLSKWYTVKKVIDTKWHWHRVQQGLQKEYGDYVRTGPRELTIFDPEAIQAILGFQSKTSKGPFYDIMEKSLHLNRDRVWHRQRRKVWDNAMKTSLSGFAPHIGEACDQLLKRLQQAEGKPILLLETMTYFSYDVMSKLAFGQAMGFTTGESSEIADKILSTFTQGLSAMGIMYHMPWLMNALGVLTSLAGPLKDWTDWSVSQMKARMAVSSPHQTPNTQHSHKPAARRRSRPNRRANQQHPQQPVRPRPPLRRIAPHHQRRERNNLQRPDLHLHAPRHPPALPPPHTRRTPLRIPRQQPLQTLPLTRRHNQRIHAPLAVHLLRLPTRHTALWSLHQRPCHPRQHHRANSTIRAEPRSAQLHSPRRVHTRALDDTAGVDTQSRGVYAVFYGAVWVCGQGVGADGVEVCGWEGGGGV